MNIIAGITVLAINFKDVNYMEKKIIVFICQFQTEYNPKIIHKTVKPKIISDTYILMKNDFKKCVEFDPYLDQFWLYLEKQRRTTFLLFKRY